MGQEQASEDRQQQQQSQKQRRQLRLQQHSTSPTPFLIHNAPRNPSIFHFTHPPTTLLNPKRPPTHHPARSPFKKGHKNRQTKSSRKAQLIRRRHRRAITPATAETTASFPAGAASEAAAAAAAVGRKWNEFGNFFQSYVGRRRRQRQRKMEIFFESRWQFCTVCTLFFSAS